MRTNNMADMVLYENMGFWNPIKIPAKNSPLRKEIEDLAEPEVEEYVPLFPLLVIVLAVFFC